MLGCTFIFGAPSRVLELKKSRKHRVTTKQVARALISTKSNEINRSYCKKVDGNWFLLRRRQRTAAMGFDVVPPR